MSAISTYITKIRNAIYGREVRGAIADAIETCYSNVNSASLRENAFYDAIVEAVENNIISNNATATVSLSSLFPDIDQGVYHTLEDVLTPGIYSFTNTVITKFIDIPIGLKATAGVLVVYSVTTNWRCQVLFTNFQAYVRTISQASDANRPWTEIGQYNHIISSGNSDFPRITSGEFEYLPAGTYQINAGSTVAFSSIPMVKNSSLVNVQLIPGTLISESPIKGEHLPIDPAEDLELELLNSLDDGTYHFNLHYYGVEPTTNMAYHFMSDVTLIVDSSDEDTPVTLSRGAWSDASARNRIKYPSDTVYHYTENIASGDRLSDDRFLNEDITCFELVATGSNNLDLPSGYSIVPNSPYKFVITVYSPVYAAASEMPNPPSENDIRYPKKQVQKLEIIGGSEVRVFYRTVYRYQVYDASSPIRWLPAKQSGNWIPVV